MTAIHLGKQLLRTAVHGDFGWSWDTLPTPVQRHLTGFGHGTAGIAWALAELSHATGDPQFREGVEQSLQYERHWFNRQLDNWPDFRDPAALPGYGGQDVHEPQYGLAWCHGAPGIGLGRVRTYALVGDM